jgi:hypothetical protein
MEVKLNLSNTEHKDLLSYCNLNDLLISEVVKKSFTTGFNIERYGLLGGKESTVEVIKEIEIIKEVPVEVIKEVEVIREIPVEIIKEVTLPPTEIKVIEYVDREIIREIIREIPVEKIVEKIVNIYDNSEVDKLVEKTEQLRKENEIFSIKISEKENIFQSEKNELISKIKELESKEPQVVEIIKEVPVKIEDPKMKLLEETLHTLRSEILNKDKRIKELENKFTEIQNNRVNLGATFLRGSNLDDTLYK